MSRWSLLVAGALGCACGGDDGVAPIDARADAASDAAVDGSACGTPRTIFLNRGGGTYTSGVEDDSSTNVSSVLQNETALAAPMIVLADWNSFVDCVRAKFAPFNVVVTEQDPGAIEHTEVVVIGSGAEIKAPAGVNGAAPLRCESPAAQHLFPRGIVFVMWSAATSNPSRCHVAAKMVGHTFRLDNVVSCPDVMSPATDCGPVADRVFVNEALRCGDTAPRACVCSTLTTQNSFQRFKALVGLACR